MPGRIKVLLCRRMIITTRDPQIEVYCHTDMDYCYFHMSYLTQKVCNTILNNNYVTTNDIASITGLANRTIANIIKN